MDTISDIAQFYGHTRLLTDSLQKNIKPLLEDHVICALKIRQLENGKNSDNIFDQIETLKDMQHQIERKLLNIVRGGINLLDNTSL